MTKVEMLAKLKRYKGIDRAMKQIYPQMDNGKFAKITFIA